MQRLEWVVRDEERPPVYALVGHLLRQHASHFEQRRANMNKRKKTEESKQEVVWCDKETSISLDLLHIEIGG